MKAGIDYPGVSVVFFCHDGKGNLLLQKRGKGARDHHGTWENGGGGIEHGETIEEALRREIKEEYQCDIVRHTFLGPKTYFDQTTEGLNHWLSHVHLVEVERSQVSIGEPHKIEAIDWFTLETLPYPLHPGLESDLAEFKAILESQL